MPPIFRSSIYSSHEMGSISHVKEIASLGHLEVPVNKEAIQVLMPMTSSIFTIESANLHPSFMILWIRDSA